MSKVSVIGAPLSESSHTGTTKKGILSKLHKNLSPAFIISTPVGAMQNQNIADPQKPNQIFALRGVVAPPIVQGPSNMMAGAPPPKPLSFAVPQPPGGNVSGVPPVQPAQVLAGTLDIFVPVKNNKPMISKIKDVRFRPSLTNVTGITPVFNVNVHKKSAPIASAPP